MDKLKHIDEYFIYLEKLQHDALTNLRKLIYTHSLKGLSERQLHDYVCLRLNANPATLEYVKKRMSKKLFDHLNGFDLTNKIDILDLKMTISYLNKFEFHKKQNMSTDGREFRREINRIKKDANRIGSLVTEDNYTIKLPQAKHYIKYALIEYFRSRGILSKESIKNISLLFANSLPRSKVKSTDEIHNSYSKLGENLMDKLKEGATLASLYNSIDSDPIYKNEIRKNEYYSPKE